MTAEDHALAILGLRRGATRAQVDEAYRRLMKVHHPDRAGGDSNRAAEVNRAYTMLRRHRDAPVRRPPPSVPIRTAPKPRRSPFAGWLIVLGIGASAIVGLVSGDLERDSPAGREWVSPDASSRDGVSLTPAVNFDTPLNASVIANAISDAEHFDDSGDLSAAIQYSRICHERLRQGPNLIMFDACAAFDESIFVLNADKPGATSGTFDSQAVLAREIGSARIFSGDAFDADSRIHQIRSMVEYSLLPKIDGTADVNAP